MDGNMLNLSQAVVTKRNTGEWETRYGSYMTPIGLQVLPQMLD
jgi:hypothetical protein